MRLVVRCPFEPVAVQQMALDGDAIGREPEASYQVVRTVWPNDRHFELGKLPPVLFRLEGKMQRLARPDRGQRQQDGRRKRWTCAKAQHQFQPESPTLLFGLLPVYL